MSPIILYDLDGTISDDRWRRPYIWWAEDDLHLRYHDYHRRCQFDKVMNREILSENHGQKGGVMRIVLTTRPKLYKPETNAWCKAKAVRVNSIIMRPDTDFGSSPKVKAWMVERLRTTFGGDIVAAYDDRDDVLDMYRSLNINAIKAKVQ